MPVTLETILEAHRKGDETARALLLAHCNDRIHRLAERLLPGFPRVGRWDRPSDIAQNAMIRLDRALAGVKPDSERHLLALAAMQVRRALLDRAREHAAQRRGQGNLVSWENAEGLASPVADVAAELTGPVTMDQWERFHAAVDALPELPREVFTLKWFLGADEATIAESCGCSRSTIQRAWLEAKVRLNEDLGESPKS